VAVPVVDLHTTAQVAAAHVVQQELEHLVKEIMAVTVLTTVTVLAAAVVERVELDITPCEITSAVTVESVELLR
jgi:hypothetical protein